MKILRVISSVNPVAGGPINGLVNSSRELEFRGHDLTVLSLDDPSAKWVSEFPFNLITFKSFIGTYSYSARFKQWLLDNICNYDVVVIHGVWQYHSYICSRVCLKKRIPYVVFVHGMLDPWFNKGRFLKALKKRIYWGLVESHGINRADRLLFTAEDERRLAGQSFRPYSPKETVVAYGCPRVNVDEQDAVEDFLGSFECLRDKRIMLFLSRIHRKKGIDLLVRALGRKQDLPDDFVVAVAGPDNDGLKSELMRLIKRMGLVERVVWLGMLEGKRKWGAFLAAETFILPSHQENFGIVVAEALSASTPVLITNKVNIWREIVSAKAGVVSNDDVDGVEAMLNAWMRLSPEDKRLMSKNARYLYDRQFSIEKAVDDLEAVLLEVINRADKV